MKIIVPMAGEGNRLKSLYKVPKPFILIDGVPMVLRVIEPFKALESEFIFICRKEHEPHTETLPGRKVFVDETTEGTACTVALAAPYVDPYESILIVNSDQLVKFDTFSFLALTQHPRIDGIIFTFLDPSKNPKWSYVKVDDNNQIIDVAEKNPISTIATCGVYYWSLFQRYMTNLYLLIEKDLRVNNEFYSSMVYKANGGIYVPFMVDEMIGLGDQESVEKYLNSTQR